MTGLEHRRWQAVGVLFVSLLVSGTVAAKPSREHPPVVGVAMVIDGDTISIDDSTYGCEHGHPRGRQDLRPARWRGGQRLKQRLV